MKTTILLICCALHYAAQSPDTLTIKFRTVPISSGRAVTLQADIATIQDISISSRPDHYYLKKGTFAGTDSIDIETNSKNQIVAVAFFYAKDYKYPKGVKVFTALLGKGREYQYSSDQAAFKVMKWQDRLTTFELIEQNLQGSKKMHSIMFDKELFTGKIKTGQDQTYLDNSFEILRAMNVL